MSRVEVPHDIRPESREQRARVNLEVILTLKAHAQGLAAASQVLPLRVPWVSSFHSSTSQGTTIQSTSLGTTVQIQAITENINSMTA